MTMVRLVLLFLSICAMSACQTRGTEGLPTVLPTVGSVQTVGAPGERLVPLDIISVSVFGAPDLNGDYQVDFEGKLKMPLIGEVQAAGRTPLGLAGVLEQRYEESYLQNADVTVLMKEAREQFITIDGAVAKPGQYPMTGKTTLMQAIALSGGVDEDTANLKRVVVFREVDGVRHVAGFNLADIRDGTSPDPEITQNDIVIVDGSNLRRDYRDLVRAVPVLTIFRPF